MAINFLVFCLVSVVLCTPVILVVYAVNKFSSRKPEDNKFWLGLFSGMRYFLQRIPLIKINRDSPKYSGAFPFNYTISNFQMGNSDVSMFPCPICNGSAQFAGIICPGCQGKMFQRRGYGL
jgi:hypothetical protein